MWPKKKFYITTSIAYTNAPPHLGFALELIQADVLARYHRFLKKDVFFLTGTDEHGLKIERKAREAGQEPLTFVNTLSEKFQELTKVLHISNNDFIRTTDRQRHWPTVEKIWRQLVKKGDIYKKQYRGLYCVGCEAFLKEKDLVNGQCPYHQKKPEIVEEENYFFRLAKYAPLVKKEIEKNKIKIVPAVRRNEILNFIQQGVEDISISRSKKQCSWGIPVPDDPDQIIYVWFDALLNYLWPRRYWPADIQCIGKDIFRFHALIWPAILLAANLKRPKTIFVHGFITVGGQKMSKSLGLVVDPFVLVKNYGVDAVRYFFLREIPTTEDGDFTLEKFIERYNGDLANGLGNLVARVVTLAEKLKIKYQKSKLKIKNQKLKKEIKNIWKDWQKAIEEFKFNEALGAVWRLISFCDRYIEQERPWEVKNQKSKIKNQNVIKDLLGTLNKIAQMLQPFLPETSEKILEQLESKKSHSLFPRFK